MIGNLEPAQYIRPYEPADYEQVTAILHTADAFSAPDHTAENFERTHEDYGPESTLVYASHDQEAGSTALVGVVRILSMEPDHSKAVIGDLAVLPEQQPDGAGNQLLRAVSNVARKNSPRCQPELAPELLANDAAGLRAAGALAAVEIFAQPTLVELLADKKQLGSAAYQAAGEIYTTLLEWGYNEQYLQATDTINDWVRSQQSAPFNQIALDDVVDTETGAGMAELYLGHPHREAMSSRKLSNFVWCAVRAANEAFQVLRLVARRSDKHFDMDFFDVDGSYVVRDVENEALYSLKVSPKNGLEEEVTARAIVSRKGDRLCKELIQGTYVLDELHRHDLRWRGESGYPWPS